MSENKKPRIFEVLGVEVGEEWTIGKTTYRITWDGRVELLCPSGSWRNTKFISLDLINHPEKIKRKSRWTAEDIADAKAVRRLWPDAWSVKPGREYMIIYNSACVDIGYLDKKIFPSIQPGESVDLDVILEAEK